VLHRPFFAPRLIGRVAAVTYFMAGVSLGYYFLKRFMNEHRHARLIYALISVFSLFQIEQSRYGTGDVVSFFLLMLIIVLCCHALMASTKGVYRRYIYMVTAFFFTGVLTAVKYPLIFFLIIPVGALYLIIKKEGHRNKAVPIVLTAGVFVAGFFLFSPKAFADPMYILRASARELNAYTTVGNFAKGGPLEHFLNLFIYMSLYSGFPLAPFFIFYAFKRCWRKPEQSPLDILINRILPVCIVIFTLYNLFIENMVMRTLYPLFFLTDIYIASAVAEFMNKKKTGRRLVCLMLLLMVLRGSWFISVMAVDRQEERMSQLVINAVDDDWEKTTGLDFRYMIMPDKSVTLLNLVEESLADDRYSDNKQNSLKGGELLITGSLDYCKFSVDILPWTKNHRLPDSMEQRWENFKEQNLKYMRGQLYPKHLYYLSGGWIEGTTATDFEFPAIYLYYMALSQA